MSSSTAGVVIVGASVAGVRTAQALRREGFDGRVVLLSDEAVMPYDKPPLSKGFLAGAAGPDQIALLTEVEADELGVEVRLNSRARRLHLAEHLVELDTGEHVAYHRLVVATGASARESTWPVSGVHVVRTMSDAQRLRADLERGGHLVVIGAGFVGSEVAATARMMGLQVTLVDPNTAPMTRIAGNQLGARFIRLHQDHGVDTRFGTSVLDVSRKYGRLHIDLSDGAALTADTCVVGIGAVPNDAWLASSGVRIDNGVLCDEYCRAIGNPDVYAVGDVARWHNPRRGLLTRHEHWTNAHEQANTVAHNIIHAQNLIAFAPIEYVWSDQYDWKIRIAGQIGVGTCDIVEVIGDEATERFAVLSSCDGASLSGIVAVNWPRALIAGRKALAHNMSYTDLRQAIEQLLSAMPTPVAMEGAK
ncbi:MAG TPA: FAD/NAD(P)-binding oxidoreductase [Mycobacterium sp.]|nr:FAD/NAD(P)-binding oxidoreductase [Mycobacterium sp.]